MPFRLHGLPDSPAALISHGLGRGEGAGFDSDGNGQAGGQNERGGTREGYYTGHGLTLASGPLWRK